MSEHNLFTGTEDSSIFQALLEVPPQPPGECIRTFDQLKSWIASIGISIKSVGNAIFSFTAGPPSAVGPDDKDKLRILFDEQGRFLGPALWIPEVGNWSLAGVPGEIKTIVRSEDSIELDMEAKALNGWFLCDGSTAGAPDLTPKTVTDSGSDTHTANPSPFFSGSAPEWDRYSVMKLA